MARKNKVKTHINMQEIGCMFGIEEKDDEGIKEAFKDHEVSGHMKEDLLVRQDVEPRIIRLTAKTDKAMNMINRRKVRNMLDRFSICEEFNKNDMKWLMIYFSIMYRFERKASFYEKTCKSEMTKARYIGAAYVSTVYMEKVESLMFTILDGKDAPKATEEAAAEEEKAAEKIEDEVVQDVAAAAMA